jgi:hypothetical protein
MPVKSPAVIVTRWLITVGANTVVFLAAIALAMRFAYLLTNSAALQLSLIGVALAAAGALSRLWSQHWSAVATPAALVSLAMVVFTGMEIYLGDGGDPNVIWRYVPGAQGVSAAVVMTGCALAAGPFWGKHGQLL